MNFPWKKSIVNKLKTPNEMREELGLEIVKEQEVNDMGDKVKQTVEELFENLIEHEYVGTSPIDGSPVGSIRATDVYRVICDYFNVDPKDTEWSDYA